VNVGIALGNLGFAMTELMAPEDHAELCCRLAEEAERLGFHSVWVGDHVALPLEPTTPYPYGTGAPNRHLGVPSMRCSGHA
jgi:alkanesulfonate monooxygenase SsuD/methylene tetrahydromethanopterin reductase-like flavin-dependent oxidoreductase (luciferase family)